MTRRCPYCKRAPETVKLEMNGLHATTCTTEGCRCQLYALGKTPSLAEACWDDCIKRRDY